MLIVRVLQGISRRSSRPKLRPNVPDEESWQPPPTSSHAQRIDADRRRALLFRLTYERPQMRIRSECVRAPQDDQFCFADGLGIGAHPVSVDEVESFAAGR